MKTKIFLMAMATICLLNTGSMNAQVKYGIHAGANLETQAELGLLWNNVDLYQGYTFGGFVDYKAGKILSLQAEVNYQKKGEKVESTPAGVKTVLRREFNYVSVPLLLKGNFHSGSAGDKWDFNLFTGPYLGYLASVHSNLKSEGTTTRLDINEQAEKSDWGAIFGGGVTYNLRNGGALVFDLRYQMGLSKIDKEDPDLRNKGAGIVIGYRF
jgi:hypothetical protein